MPELDVAAVRAQLPVTRRTAYLNAGTFGPLPLAAVAAMRARDELDLHRGRSGPDYFGVVQAALDDTRAAIAQLLGCVPAEVALTHSTTDACQIVIKGLGLNEREEIVTTDAEHFGLLGPVGAGGARVRVVAVESEPPERAVELIAAAVGPRTRLLAVSHVAWSTGNRLPVEALTGLDVPLLVDGAQSVGAIPVDVAALGCDFYTVSGQKWLLGPECTGALYVRPDALGTLEVALPSYLSQAGYEPDGRFTPVAGAARFDPSWMATAAMHGWLASLQWLAGLGAAAQERAAEMSARCRELLAGRVEVVTAPGQATLVTFAPREPADAVAARLAAAGVIVRAIPGRDWVRASVGFWTDEDDLQRLLEQL